MVAPLNNLSITDEQAAKLLREIRLMSKIQELTNSELSNMAIDVLAKNDGCDYWILSELTNRFDKFAGIKRSEETGEIVK